MRISWPETWEQDYKEWKNGERTAVCMFKTYGWTSTIFYRKVILRKLSFDKKNDFRRY